MFKKNDPHSFSVYHSLYDGSTNLIGYLIADYQVTKYDDVLVQDTLSVNKKKERNFLLHCTQRIIISNQLTIAPSSETNSYPNYPALIVTNLNLSNTEGKGLNIEVLNYSPHTVNTKVQQAGSSGSSSGTTLGVSKSSTVGSSTSVSNTYGTTVSVGATPLSDSASASYEHSTSVSHDHSSSVGSNSSSSNSQEASDSASMSVKDWGAYGMINPSSQSPNWIFGQEYPWDAIECIKTDGKPNPENSNQQRLVVPQEMLARLYDGVCLYPPSQLSLFGVNFVMKAVWLINMENDVSDDINIQHTISYSSASHVLDTNKAEVYMDTAGSSLLLNDMRQIITKLNLPLMALEVLGQANKPAITGFLPEKFVVNPSAGPFKIISSSNNLMVMDSTDYPSTYPSVPAFSASETALNCSAIAGLVKPPSITLYFKVVDTVNDYNLYMKHWIVGAKGVKLSISINNTYTITKYVTTQEAEGGENNLLTIALRKQDFSSVDYHDYLQLGLNAIVVSIQSIDGSTDDFTYQLRALSIEKI